MRLGQSHWFSGAPTDGTVHGAAGREVDEIGVVRQAQRIRQVTTDVLADHVLLLLPLGLAVALDATGQVDRLAVGTREATNGGVGFDDLDGACVLRLAHGSSFHRLKCAINGIIHLFYKKSILPCNVSCKSRPFSVQ